MPNLFQGYCYPTLSDAVNADIAQGVVYTIPVSGGSSFLAADGSYWQQDSDTEVQIYLRGMNPASGQPDFYSRVVKTYPLCSTVGYYPEPFSATVDWAVVNTGFAFCVAMFMIGAGCGLLLNVVRKAK